MERKFDLKLENVESGNISIRFYSKYNLKLSVLRIKAFYRPKNFDEYGIALVPVYLDNNASIKIFSLDITFYLLSLRMIKLSAIHLYLVCIR